VPFLQPTTALPYTILIAISIQSKPHSLKINPIAFSRCFGILYIFPVSAFMINTWYITLFHVMRAIYLAHLVLLDSVTPI
jgi:hypothetical protein